MKHSMTSTGGPAGVVSAAVACAALGLLAPGVPQTYRIENVGGRWAYVAPDGRRFFSLGVCCVMRGADAETYSPKNPEYAAHLYYRWPEEWAADTLTRLIRWGFTTVGGWSDYQYLTDPAQPGLPITPVLHVGSTAGIPWLDMWDPAVLQRVDETARTAVEAVRSSPLVLGYYADNELGWWTAVLFRMTLEMPPESIQRRKTVSLIKRIYRGSWDRLLRDFDPDGADSFAEFERRGILYLRPGGNGARLQRRIAGFLADRYYQVTSAAIRKYDPHRLLLGDRYQSFYIPEVARAAGRHLDVMSTNLNAHWIDGSYAPYYTRTLHSLTAKPVQIGEFYMCAAENRSGNRNSSAAFPVVPTQKERAKGFRTTVRQLVGEPYIVGADWFQYFDEPTKGRSDGEDYNMGLVDIHNVPYAEITEAAASLDLARLRQSSNAAASAGSPRGVPRAPEKPLDRFEGQHAIVRWNREGGRIPPVTRHPVADLYACWDASNLYLAIHAMGFLEAQAYRDAVIPECDRSLWTISFGSRRQTARIRFGGGRPAACDDPDVRALSTDDAESDVRAVVAAVIPAKSLHCGKLEAGMKVALDAVLDTAGRCDRVRWKAALELR